MKTHMKETMIRCSLYLVIYLATNIESITSFDLTYLMSIWPFYAPYQSRLIKQWLYVEIGAISPELLWVINAVTFALSIELFRQFLLMNGISKPTSEFSSVLLFATSCQVGIDQFCLVFSVWLFMRDKKWALRIQLIMVWVKELIPVLIFAWYALENSSTIKQAVKNSFQKIIRDREVILIYLVTAGAYLAVRMYYTSIQTGNSYKEPLSLGSGTVFQFYLYLIGDERALWDWTRILLNLLAAFHVIWYSAYLLFFRGENRDVLYLAVIFSGFILLWSFVWEVDKVFFFFPWLYLLFAKEFDRKFFLDHLGSDPEPSDIEMLRQNPTHKKGI